MKKMIALLLALVMCLSLCACGGGSLSKDEMLDNATTVFAHQITFDIAGNKARAEGYKGKTYCITGHVCEVEDDYCMVVAKTVSGDNCRNIHCDGWYAFNCNTVFLVHLSTEELANLNLCDGIEFVGVIDEVGTREYHAIKDQIYLELNAAYYIGTAEYEGKYRL